MLEERVIGDDRPATKPEWQVFSEIEDLLEDLWVYIHVLDLDRAGQELNEIKEGLQQLSPESEPGPAPRTVAGPTLEDLMEAPIHSVLQHHPIHGRLVKTSSHLWKVEGPVPSVHPAHYYYYAEEIAELQSMTLFHPESEEA